MTPLRFVVSFGVVSALADVVYEGARSIIGPFLGDLGASAALVGLITGAGEATALVLRLVTGRLADRTGRHWALTITGYALTIACVPLLALSPGLIGAGLLYNGERFGKAVRTPARDTMLAHASTKMGRGWAFGLHEAIDQSGAVLGPLLLAGVLATGGSFRTGFALLAIPGAAALAVLLRLRAAVPDPTAFDPTAQLSDAKKLSLGSWLPTRFWLYAAFSAATMLGFATWAVLAYHLSTQGILPTGLVPVLYAAAMGAAALTALVFGRIYDRAGLRGLVVLPILTAVVPFLSFTHSIPLVILGAVVWGAAMGAHESTLRAAVADLVPAHRRGAGYGTFTAIYGLAWLAGASIIGALYNHGITAIGIYVLATQALAVALLTPLLRTRTRMIQ
ncbi:MAG: MFS transporter [Pseudonocardiales bacterium]|nr:MFS transporter [Pseudonocardiales bacterium]PZS25337.1 MAG: MFS transporter [Pseudonocardiales bacterium]